ncbi:MAG: efflux RND transporter periplasmic adaptor subunit [Desulfobacterales bacterium]|nr:efflux RND transporter periplasmic adaptor subunit [Desulfobacterales bacterium]
MKKKLVLLGFVIIIILGALFLVNRKQLEIAALPKPASHRQTIQTAIISQGKLEITTHYLGIIEPYTRSELSPRISGNILSLNKREGDSIREGELVIVIDDRELTDKALATNAEYLATQKKLTGAKSAFETQQSIYERDELLYKEGAISKEALERSKANYDGAHATLAAFQETLQGLAKSAAAARTQAGYAKILAPFDGIIVKRWSDTGDLAVPGKPILTIEKSSPYKVVIQIPQEEVNYIRKGTKAYLQSGEQNMSTTINRVYPALNKNLLCTVDIILSTPPFSLPSGATVGVDMVTNEVEGFLTPVNAIVKTGKSAFIYLVDKGVIRIQQIELLATSPTQAVIKGPITQGSIVAVEQENKLLSLAEGIVVNSVGGKP